MGSAPSGKCTFQSSGFSQTSIEETVEHYRVHVGTVKAFRLAIHPL
jgi:hypothetical protein